MLPLGLSTLCSQTSPFLALCLQPSLSLISCNLASPFTTTWNYSHEVTKDFLIAKPKGSFPSLGQCCAKPYWKLGKRKKGVSLMHLLKYPPVFFFFFSLWPFCLFQVLESIIVTLSHTLSNKHFFASYFEVIIHSEEFAEFPCTLHLVPPSHYILYNYSMVSKPGHWHWYTLCV